MNLAQMNVEQRQMNYSHSNNTSNHNRNYATIHRIKEKRQTERERETCTNVMALFNKVQRNVFKTKSIHLYIFTAMLRLPVPTSNEGIVHVRYKSSLFSPHNSMLVEQLLLVTFCAGS